MNVVPCASERGDLQPASADGLSELLGFAIAREQFVNRTVTRSGVPAGAKFHGLNAEASKIVESRFESFRSQDDGENANFHGGLRLAERLAVGVPAGQSLKSGLWLRDD
jgi:hypothetical protein